MTVGRQTFRILSHPSLPIPSQPPHSPPFDPLPPTFPTGWRYMMQTTTPTHLTLNYPPHKLPAYLGGVCLPYPLPDHYLLPGRVTPQIEDGMPPPPTLEDQGGQGQGFGLGNSFPNPGSTPYLPLPTFLPPPLLGEHYLTIFIPATACPPPCPSLALEVCLTCSAVFWGRRDGWGTGTCLHTCLPVFAFTLPYAPACPCRNLPLD